ncbi:hypothetical protein F5888DRAFT_1667571 [Russula emetica]|nr:hypothetical protein F5888DRAFT_1667571 [Russula emetica]
MDPSSPSMDPLMDPSSPSMDPSSLSSIRPIPDSFADRYDEALGRVASDKGSGTSMEPLFTPGSSAYGSDNEWVGEHSPRPNPNPEPTGPVDGADPEFDWNYWTNKESPPIPSSPKEGIGLDPEYQGHEQQFNTRPSTGPDSTDPDPNFDWDYWMNRDDPLAPSPTQKWVPKLRVKTKPDSDPNLMAPQQPPPYPLSPTEDHYPNLPSGLGSDIGSPKKPENEVESLSPDSGSPKEPENEVIPEEEDDVIKDPPPTPELTDPELNSDHQLLSTGTDAESQLHSVIYAAKGKAKEER